MPDLELTVKQAAKELRRSERTVRRLAAGSCLSLYDATGNVVASLGVQSHGPSLLLYGPEHGWPRVGLAVNPDGSNLVLRDAKWRQRAVIGCTGTENKTTGATTEYPESTLTLFKDNGDVLWQGP